MPRLDRLPPRDRDGQLRIVVETPRGSRLKLAFDPETRAIQVDRALPEDLDADAAARQVDKSARKAEKARGAR